MVDIPKAVGAGDVWWMLAELGWLVCPFVFWARWSSDLVMETPAVRRPCRPGQRCRRRRSSGLVASPLTGRGSGSPVPYPRYEQPFEQPFEPPGVG